MSEPGDRLAALRQAKLRALVRGYLATMQPSAGELALVEPPNSSFAHGAVVRSGDDVWVYVSGDPERALGRALALFVRQSATALHLVLDADSGNDARRAALLAVPVHVWRIEGTVLVAATPTPLLSPADPPAGQPTTALVHQLTQAGVDVVVEHGVIIGEVLGLEVARVSVDGAGAVSLEIGVGRFDQEANALLHREQPVDAALARALSVVAEHRRVDAAPHPLNRLARERWMRAQLVDDPTAVAMVSIVAISPPLPRRSVKDPAPAAAIAYDAASTRVLVMCTVGIDLEWVPVAADLIERERPDRVVVALAQRDLVQLQRDLAALLPVPVAFVVVGS